MSDTSIVIYRADNGAPKGREWLGIILEDRGHWGILFFGADEAEATRKTEAFRAEEMAKREAIAARLEKARAARKKPVPA